MTAMMNEIFTTETSLVKLYVPLCRGTELILAYQRKASLDIASLSGFTTIISQSRVCKVHIDFQETQATDSSETDQTLIFQTSLPKDSLLPWRIEEFMITAFNILVASQIAYPGSIFSNGFKYSIDDELFPTRWSFKNFQCYSYNHNTKPVWPEVTEMPLEKLARWCKAGDLNLKTISNSRSSRAINAFSHLFNPTDVHFSEVILWSFIGIESLCIYDSNEQGKTSKLQKRLRSIFGEPPMSNNTKRNGSQMNLVAKMAYFRGEFIHGALDVPPVIFREKQASDFKHVDELDFEASNVSLVLTALLQKLVYQNLPEFQFDD